MSDFELNKITGNEPPTGETCAICNEHKGVFEACVDCHNSLWGKMIQYREIEGGANVARVIVRLGIDIKEIETIHPEDENTAFTALIKQEGVTTIGRGITRTAALADLFAQMLLAKEG